METWPSSDATYWQGCADVIRRYDPHIQGIIVLGKEADLKTISACFDAAQAEPLVKGFAIGRTIFAGAAQSWLADEITDSEARTKMNDIFKSMLESWDSAKGNNK